MLAIGCDIERIGRFKEVVRNKYFLSRVFSKREIRHCLGKKRPEFHLAVRFACKEAVFKALSPLGRNVSFRLIEISSADGKRASVNILHKGIKKRYNISLDVSAFRGLILASSLAERTAGY